MSTDDNTEEAHARAVSDLASLGRVSHKLALTEGGPPLERVLTLLLPRLLARVGPNQSALQQCTSSSSLQHTLSKIHAKLVEMLSHIMQRVKADDACQLPCLAMLQLLYNKDDDDDDDDEKEQQRRQQVDAFTMNLTLAFLNVGIPRYDHSLLPTLLPGLLRLLASTCTSTSTSITTSSAVDEAPNTSSSVSARKSQSHQVAQLLLQVIQRMVTEAMRKRQNDRDDSSNVDNTATASTLAAMTEARRLLCSSSNEEIASALFDLMLDTLLVPSLPLTPPSNSTMPPPGLSQAGHERLGSFRNNANARWSSSTDGTSWKDLQIAILDFIVPTKQWTIFGGNDDDTTLTTTTTTTLPTTVMKERKMGMARTMALLVVATSSDLHPSVSEHARSYLKTILDDAIRKGAVTDALGNVMALSCTLLTLVLGETNAETALRAIVSPTGSGDDETCSTSEPLWRLGSRGTDENYSSSTSAQQVLSFKRRMASTTTAAACMSFVSSKVLDDDPQLFHTLGPRETRALGTLAVLSANNVLTSSSVATTSTANMSMLRAGPYVAAAQLLNSLAIRLVSFHEPPIEILAKCLSTVCTVLSQVAATPRPTTTTTTIRPSSTVEGSIAMRDACYGVVCALSRSNHANSFIFTCGKLQKDGVDSCDASSSMETAKLLFACAANEEETLRPRAVAALDALLGAYCRVYAFPTQTHEDEEQHLGSAAVSMEIDQTEINPWATQTVSDVARMKSTENGAILPVEDSKRLARVLLPLLWSAAQTSQPKASRVAAARWSSELLRMLDLGNACHILCFLAGDKDVTASSIAREGLGVDKMIGEAYDEQQVTSSDRDLPDFSVLTALLFKDSSKSSQSTNPPQRPRYYGFSYHGKAAALRFGLLCLLADLYGGEDNAVASYVTALCETLTYFGRAKSGRGSVHGRESVDLLDECSICLAGCMSTSRFARCMIRSGRSSFGVEDMEALAILADSSRARRYLAEACGWIYRDESLWKSTQDGEMGLEDWVETCQILRPFKVCAKKLTGMNTNIFDLGEVHGAAFLGARCCRAFRLMALKKETQANSSVEECWHCANAIIDALGRGAGNSDETIGNAFAQGLSIALLYDGGNAPILDKRIYEGTTSALTSLNMAVRRYGNGDHTDATRASTLAHATGIVLAASTSAAGYVSDDLDGRQNVGPARIQCVDALFSLVGSTAFRKDPEVGLVAGEALAEYADAYGPSSAVWSSIASDWPESYSDEYANELPPHQQILYVLLRREINVSSPQKRTAVAPALLAVVGRAARLANGGEGSTKRVFVKEVVQRLPEIQAAFITLLADPKSKQLSRESCCIGLAACQGLAQAVTRADVDTKTELGNELNESLLRAFGQTTNFGCSAMMETRAQNAERRRRNNQEADANASIAEPFGIETEVGGAAGMGEAALGAYREMAAAALSLGRSDVLYALFLLSISHPVWFSPGPRDRYSASAILGEHNLIGSRTNSLQMREALRPHLSKLLPRMLRGCHDPNKQTREQMNTLWIGLTGGGAESRKAISENLLPTIDILIEDASSKLWRARVGACGALAEVVVGRSWDELGGGAAILDDDDIFVKTSTFNTTAAVRLLRLWRVAVRALDDVRLSVRESGETLARSVRSLTARLCDPTVLLTAPDGKNLSEEEQRKNDESARAAASTSLRWLVKHGLNQPCAEAVGACVSCLLGIVDVVQPTTLQPVLAELIGALLVAISGLEPAALNYLQVRSAGRDAEEDSYDRLERARLQMAQSGPIAGALNKCLEMVPSVDISVQKEVIPQFDSALRSGVGFATRAATADAVSSLCTASPGAFDFPGHGTTNPTVRLLRALYYASEREHGQGARDKMAHALGNLAAISPGQSVRSLAVRACARYSGATGNNDDPAARRAAAAALRALAVRASNQLVDGGPRDVWRSRVLPLAFLGQKDTDKKVASLWKEVWEEGGAAAHIVDAENTSSSSFGVLLEEKLLPDLVRACIDALNDVSWARRRAACTALIGLCDQNILAPISRSTRTSAQSTPQSELFRAKQRSQASLAALTACVKLMVKPRVWTGKADVVKAATKIAAQWVIVCSNNDLAALGWDDSDGESCPWIPVSLSRQDFGRDLFRGDGWFERMQDDDDPQSSELDAVDSSVGRNGVDEEEDVEMSDSNGTKLDFEEGDTILASDIEADLKTNLNDVHTSVMFSGLSKALLEQGFPSDASLRASFSDDILPYRAALLAGLSELLKVINGEAYDAKDAAMVGYQIAIYRMIAPKLLSVIGKEMFAEAGDDNNQAPEAPLIIARSVECLAAGFWNGMGKDTGEEHPEEDVLSLSGILQTLGGHRQPAWSVREASLLGAACLASKCVVQALRNPRVVDNFLGASKHALSDRKFWRVRLAGLQLLYALVERTGNAMTGGSSSLLSSRTLAANSSADARQQEEQLALEALLPHKETILQLGRSSLTDNESKVTAAASNVVGAMTWWP